MRHTRAAVVAVVAVTCLVVTGCSGSGSSSPPAPHVGGTAGDTRTTSYDAALSRPRHDTVYPDVGDPGIDTLHYGLDLTWDPTHQRLSGTETVLLRATEAGDHLRLDLGRPLVVSHVWVDGKAATFAHTAKELVVDDRVTANSRHVLQLTYAGTPEPVTAPTDRLDFSTTGWTVAGDGTVWTMQEPYGAYSWYAVNDHPSDKAFYDVTIHAPKGDTGVSNGTLVSRRTVGAHTVTRWHLPEPAASYLMTIAIGHFTRTADTGPHGLPITYWTPAGRPGIVRRVRYAPKALAYLEGLLGRYPFPTLGILVVPANSAMETQSMLTLGDNKYTLSRDTVVHEIAHQWYGDVVTPNDWSDLWMNEGMATYVAEANWSGTHTPFTRTRILRRLAMLAPRIRAQYGPPASYRPGSFAESNAYYLPALMWDTIRQRLGDQEFWRLVRRWPATHRFTSQDRSTLAAWWSRQSGQNLEPLFHAWLLDTREPPFHPGG